MDKMSECESRLIDIGKWAMLGVKISGYFPLKIQRTFQMKSLKFNFLSFQVIYSLLLVAALISWDFVFYYRQNSFKKHLKARGATELYAYNLMTGIGSLLGIYLTIFGLKNPKKFLGFWKATCLLLDQLKSCCFHINKHQHPMDQDCFKDIEKSGRRSFFTLLAPVSLHVLIVYGYLIVDSILDEDGTLDDTQLAIGLGFWTFFAVIESGISIWMTFFIQVYSACFKSVEESLKSLTKLKKEQEEIDVYIDEIFTTSRKPKDYSKKKDINSFRNYERDVERSLEMFQSIVKEIEHFNDFFGNILVFEMGACVVNLLVYLFFALIWLGRSQFGLLLEGIVPIYVYGKELYDIGTFSEKLTMFAEQVIKTCSEDVALENLSPQVHLKIQLLVTQISTNPPTVSAKQFFVINRSFVTSILSALATFLVVLVQFRDADE